TVGAWLPARFPEQRLRLRGIEGIRLAQRRVVEHDRGERRERLERGALEDGREKCLLVDGMIDGAADAHVIHGRLRRVEQPDAWHTWPRHLVDPHRRIALE